MKTDIYEALLKKRVKKKQKAHLQRLGCLSEVGF
jgi:hypothetical protein